MNRTLNAADAVVRPARDEAATVGGRRERTFWLGAALSLVLIGNAVAIVWLWLHGGGVGAVQTSADLWTSIGRITGLFAVYLALLQIVLLSRLPPLERLLGFDKLTVWHRRNGMACIALVVAHVVFITVGYAGSDQVRIPTEITRLLDSYPGMVAATVGTAIMLAVVVASFVIVRRRLPYEAWYAVHLTVYGGIVLAYLHQLPTGNEFTANPAQADYWIALNVAVLALLVIFRLARPARLALRHRLAVAEVVREGAGVVSIYITGRHLDRLDVRGGQFMIWRFLTAGRWWQAHPFSLSREPDGRTLRITVKAVGRYTLDLANVPVGTRVLSEGPFGRFTLAARRRTDTVLIGGGIGVTPLRCLLEELPPGGNIHFIQRAIEESDLVLGEEISELAAARDATVHALLGDHRRPGSEHLLSPEHLLELVPGIAASDVFVCGPPQMMTLTTNSLRALGVPSSQIHSERFALAA
jgi:predicted ferric reductase